ncbi:MAG TPA: DUF6526 family protein [Candidatus Acidoferrales bacterium]|jgi:hypothetical protein|nr:DUF6526 family protein [Candidatus Acidoferrales bacterium]
MSETQNVQHHARFFPPFHFVVMPIFVVNLVWSIYRVVRAFSTGSVISLLVAVALLILAFSARVMALTVQDRVIRLEMQLRLQQVLPAELRSRVREFTVNQLVALRFAGDGELPELARKVLQDKITDRKTIKQLVRDWQPDFQRA